jgi:hypothetical protein
MITRAAAIASIAALAILIAAWSNATPKSPCVLRVQQPIEWAEYEFLSQACPGHKSLEELQQEWREVRRMWND